MYEIYKTKAIIISRENYLERSKKIVVFTYDFGFIYVDAHGISFEKSKNKKLLQSGNYIEIYMVRGKKRWIVSGGEVIENVYYGFNYIALKNLFLNLNILRKNSVSNIPQKDIFSYFEKYFFSERSKTKYGKIKDEAKREIYFLKITRRILKSLGYWDDDIDKFSDNKEKVLKINNILKKI